MRVARGYFSREAKGGRATKGGTVKGHRGEVRHPHALRMPHPDKLSCESYKHAETIVHHDDYQLYTCDVSCDIIEIIKICIVCFFFQEILSLANL